MRHCRLLAAGVAMDDLVYICTKIARQMDTNGLDRMFEAADAATAAIEEARPLLTKAQDLANEVSAFLHPLRPDDVMMHPQHLS